MSLHHAPRWTSEFLLRSMDVNRTPAAKRKSSRGIRIERIRGRVCVVRGQVVITAYQIARWTI